MSPGASVPSARVRAGFAAQAHAYERHAALQRAIAWRLARHCRDLPLPAGPAADLGAGSGLLAQALSQQSQSGRGCSWLEGRGLLQLDLCPELLARNPAARRWGGRHWDLEQGLPAELSGAALLCSSFALQWLSRPAVQLEHWCRHLAPGGWLALAVPTAASFPQWRRAAARSGVPFTGLELPGAADLEAVTRRELVVRRQQRLRFSRRHGGGHRFLRQLRALGAGTSPHPPLSAPQLRRLLQHWPTDEPVTWELLLLIGQRSG
ncbi:methyltransferase domain-containing protein [Cyanobium sp. CH-040]|uniref:methyltransferase domain-containing protein n=1 Tax=Cyanobium sp. CH-040 TaxID=2823708 RepID=UPI0020CFCCA6|nr:methyltransferase domain-containing protein [Cyanobium sp. CH-040]MCP9927982.1 methyltransferase domain-containing protein [Cyanobium sp. CH-040]